MWRTLWRAVREVAAGIDAGSAVRHGLPVGENHPARIRNAATPTPHLAAPVDVAEWADSARSGSRETGRSSRAA
jgi:hypothetical protein